MYTVYMIQVYSVKRLLSYCQGLSSQILLSVCFRRGWNSFWTAVFSRSSQMGLKVSGSSGSLRHLKPSHAAQRAWRRARSRIHGYPGPSGVTSFLQHLLWIDLIEGDLLGVIRWGQATIPENPTCLCGHCGVDDISGGRRWEEMEIIYGWTWNSRNVTGRGKGSQWRACWLETTNEENRSDYQDLLKLQYPPISSNIHWLIVTFSPNSPIFGG